MAAGSSRRPTHHSVSLIQKGYRTLMLPGATLRATSQPRKFRCITPFTESRGAARAIVHLHSTNAVALSMLPEIDPRAALPPMTPYCLMRAGQIALLPYYRPGDPAVADAIRGLAGKYASVLLSNHGPVVAGDTLEAAVFATEELEEGAKLYLMLRNLNPRYLTPAQVADLVREFRLDLPIDDDKHAHHHHSND